MSLLASWNDFASPLLYLFDEREYTLPLGLSLLQGNYAASESLQMAGACLTTLPLLALAFVFQRQVLRALTQGAVKG